MKARTMAKWLGMAGLMFGGVAFAQGGKGQMGEQGQRGEQGEQGEQGQMGEQGGQAQMGAGQGQTRDQKMACQKQGKFTAAVEKARNIGPQTTVGEVKQIRSNLESSYHDYARAAEKVAKPESTNLQASVSKFRRDANNISNQATLEQTRDQLKSDAEQVKMANNQLKEKLNCGVGGGGTSGMGTQKSTETNETRSTESQSSQSTGGSGMQGTDGGM